MEFILLMVASLGMEWGGWKSNISSSYLPHCASIIYEASTFPLPVWNSESTICRNDNSAGCCGWYPHFHSFSPLLTLFGSSSSKEEKSWFVIGRDLKPETLMGWHLKQKSVCMVIPLLCCWDQPTWQTTFPFWASRLLWVTAWAEPAFSSLLFTSLPLLWPYRSGLPRTGQQLTDGFKRSKSVSHWSRLKLCRLHPVDYRSHSTVKKGELHSSSFTDSYFFVASWAVGYKLLWEGNSE